MANWKVTPNPTVFQLMARRLELKIIAMNNKETMPNTPRHKDVKVRPADGIILSVSTQCSFPFFSCIVVFPYCNCQSSSANWLELNWKVVSVGCFCSKDKTSLSQL